MKVLAYLGTFLFLAVTTALTISSIVLPNWIRFKTPPTSPIIYESTYGFHKRCDRVVLEVKLPVPGGGDDGDSDALSLGGGRNASLLSHIHSPFGAQSVGLGLGAQESQPGEWKCRSFPLSGKDCDGDSSAPEKRAKGQDFCLKWRGAGYAAELSCVFAFAGLLSLFIIIIVGGRRKRRHGWKLVSAFVLLHSAFQIVSMGIIAHLFNTNERFYIGSKLDTSFALNIVSWVLDIFLALGLIVAGVKQKKDGYHRIRHHTRSLSGSSRRSRRSQRSQRSHYSQSSHGDSTEGA